MSLSDIAAAERDGWNKNAVFGAEQCRNHIAVDNTCVCPNCGRMVMDYPEDKQPCNPGSKSSIAALKAKELAKGGARFDAGKSRVDLIPAEVLLMLGEIYEMGAVKYDASNWRKGMKWSKVYGPLMRHLLKAWSCKGDKLYDDESKKHHMLHVVWNAVALALYMTRPEYQKFDDRQDVVDIVNMDESERQERYV